MTSSSLRLPEDKADIRRRELRQVLADTCRLATGDEVDALLIPGDLFDDESVTVDDLGFVIEQFGQMARPVLIAPGNHDYVSPGSIYSPGVISIRHRLAWPDNVHIFQHQAWEDFHLPGVTVTGLGFETHVELADRLLGHLISGPTDGLRVLLFHGSRQRFLPPGKLMVLPFNDDELQRTGCSYAAIGHYHDFAQIEVNGRIVGAYSGCPSGRGLDESGIKVVLQGEIADNGAVSLRTVQLDRRRVMRVPVGCGGCLSIESISTAIEGQIQSAGCSAEDIVRVELTGSVPPGLTVSFPPGFLGNKFFHLSIDGSGLHPNYDLTAFEVDGAAAETTEGRFARRLLIEMHAAETRGDLEVAAVARRAIEYGLDGFRSGTVRPRGID